MPIDHGEPIDLRDIAAVCWDIWETTPPGWRRLVMVWVGGSCMVMMHLLSGQWRD